jgi:hypothetical protein
MYERKSAPAPPYSSGMQTLAVPGGRVRLDLRLGELPRQRLDLSLIRRELKLHRGASIDVSA